MKTRAGQAGFTLVEVMVASLITALLAVAIIEVALSTKTNSVKLDRKLIASQTTKALQSALKAYVTGDPTSIKPGLCGPNTLVGVSPACNANMWCLNNGAQTDGFSGPALSMGGHSNSCWALNPGHHPLTCATGADDPRCVLPWSLRQAPYNGTLSYDVGAFSANSAPQVTININWNEP